MKRKQQRNYGDVDQRACGIGSHRRVIGTSARRCYSNLIQIVL